MRATIQQAGQFDAGVTGKFIEATLSETEKAQLAATYQQTSLAETKMSLLNILAFYRVVSEQLSRDQEMMRPIMITKIYQQFNDWLSV